MRVRYGEVYTIVGRCVFGYISCRAFFFAVEKYVAVYSEKIGTVYRDPVVFKQEGIVCSKNINVYRT